MSSDEWKVTVPNMVKRPVLTESPRQLFNSVSSDMKPNPQKVRADGWITSPLHHRLCTHNTKVQGHCAGLDQIVLVGIRSRVTSESCALTTAHTHFYQELLLHARTCACVCVCVWLVTLMLELPISA